MSNVAETVVYRGPEEDHPAFVTAVNDDGSVNLSYLSGSSWISVEGVNESDNEYNSYRSVGTAFGGPERDPETGDVKEGTEPSTDKTATNDPNSGQPVSGQIAQSATPGEQDEANSGQVDNNTGNTNASPGV